MVRLIHLCGVFGTCYLRLHAGEARDDSILLVQDQAAPAYLVVSCNPNGGLVLMGPAGPWELGPEDSAEFRFAGGCHISQKARLRFESVL